ncbi:GntR family transcriptional regulator [Corynebacterium comes]|uniref:HTH-type transcriptional regulator YidP n=1 Tax=Corynebacterium comes TaxID=2675218 RepID=A0A6B8W341_9CORY|nr:GntR family transcriptional regulator [Corynebacterium comes]QGU05346.1 putative HTH-type transcriptional regulator YidP [Corynebacterium comes]
MNHPPSRRPAYQAIADIIRERIARCEFSGGHRLPTERELVDEFGVARMTVRNALDVLQQEGLIERRRGRSGGTFVRSIPMIVDLSCMEGVVQQLRKEGREMAAEVLEVSRVSAAPCVAAALNLRTGDPVYHLARVGSVDNTPLIIENSYLPAELVPGLLEEDLRQSMPELLDTRWNLRPARKSETILPGLADDEEGKILGVNRDLPLLRIYRTTSTDDGAPVEYSRYVLRPDLAHVRVVTGAR